MKELFSKLFKSTDKVDDMRTSLLIKFFASETNNAVVIFDKNGKPEWINEGFTKMYDFNLEEFIRDRGENIFEMKNTEAVHKLIKRCFELKKTVVFSCELPKKTNEVIWIQSTLTPIVSDSGKLQKVIAVDTDISILKNAERAISRQKEELKKQAEILEKLSIVARETNNAVVIFDKNGTPEWVNEGFTKMYGFNLEEFIRERGNNLFEMKNSDQIQDVIRSCFSEKKSVRYSCSLPKKNNDNIWIQTSLTPILSKDGELQKVIAIDTDITMLKNAENEIFQQKEELKTQSEELKKVNKELEKTNHLLTDSIYYAKRIQDAIIPSEKIVKEYFPESFIFFKPKDIVSGDFLWLSRKDDFVFLAVADCTGHGVSGAFMSMMGNTLLNEIVNEKNIYDTTEILEQLNNGVIYSLSQSTGNVDRIEADGMDISMLKINLKTKEAQLALANQNIIIIRENKIVEVEQSIFSIGGDFENNKQKSFPSQSIQLETGDAIYMLSDGFQHQFGGADNSKYSISKLEELILNIHSKEIKEQKQDLENELKVWKSKRKQTDDILIFGLKI